MPGEFGEDAGLDLEARIGAAIEVLREQRHAFGMLEEVGIEQFELFGRDRLVASPPHGLVGGGIPNREFVLGAAAGEVTGVGAQCAIGGQNRLVRRKRILIKLRRSQIPVHAFKILSAEFVGAEGAVAYAGLLHRKSSSNPRIPFARMPPDARLSRDHRFNIASRPKSSDLLLMNAGLAKPVLRYLG